MTAAAGLALALTATAAQAAPFNYWRVAYRSYSTTADPLSSVTAPAANDAWAISRTMNAPLYLHWNGTDWSKVTNVIGPGLTPIAVQSSSPSNVWIFGYAPEPIDTTGAVFNGSSWQPQALPTQFSPGVVISNTDVWGSVDSSCGTSTCSTTLANWNGSTWNFFDVAGYLQGMAEAGGDAYILTLTNGYPSGSPILYQSADGGTPQQVTAPKRMLVNGVQLAGSPAGQLWLMGHPYSNQNATLVFSSSGSGWTQRAVPSQVGKHPWIVGGQMVYDGQNGFWAGPYAHWTGTRWVNENNVGYLPGADTFSLSGIAPVPGSGSVWAAGWAGKSPTDSTQDPMIAIYGGLP